jgi:hypothetical protein
MSSPPRVGASRPRPLAWLALFAGLVGGLTASCDEEDAEAPARPSEPRAGRGSGGGSGEPSVGGAPEAQGGRGAGGEAGAPALEGGSESGGQSLGGAPEAGASAGVSAGGVAVGGASAGGVPSGGAPSAGGDAGGAPGDVDLGLPCDVLSLLRTRCQSCHSSSPVAGTNVSLVDYADLTALSDVVPTVTVAARALHRMTLSLSPMPPPPEQVTPAESAALELWVDQGMPWTTCAQSHPGDDPYAAPPTCSSGGFWPGNFTGASWMMPGAACINCHKNYLAVAPLFTVAGTVYPTAHEPDKCYGVPASVAAKVIITDANGNDLPPIRVANRGNFGEILPGLALPYRARIVVGDEERVMQTPQTNGDCNACHTQAGAQGARGRIIVP